jgi:DNA-binding transcriptional ArsR family regulator
VIEHGGRFRSNIAETIYVQHIDTTYDSVDFDDPISTLSYFKKICIPVYSKSDEIFEGMMSIFKRRTEMGSKILAEVKAQQIMRSAAEKVHDCFQELNRDSSESYLNTALIVAKTILEAYTSLARLTRECIAEEYEHHQILRSRFKRS